MSYPNVTVNELSNDGSIINLEVDGMDATATVRHNKVLEVILNHNYLNLDRGVETQLRQVVQSWLDDRQPDDFECPNPSTPSIYPR